MCLPWTLRAPGSMVCFVQVMPKYNIYSHFHPPVNTRCIYHRLKASRSDPDNITLCPILDFANHNPILPHALPSPSDAGIWNTAPRSKLGDDFTLMSPANSNIEQGQELYLCYGAHANRTLFVEYGFVNEFSARILSRGEFHGEVDVQELVEHLFDQREAIGKWMRGTLENEGYWGYWLSLTHILVSNGNTRLPGTGPFTPRRPLTHRTV